MTSGVPQGSVLGLQLFPIYIDDLELGTKCSVSKFADDTQMSGKAKCAEDAESLQRDIDNLSEWVRVWQMEYNVVLYIQYSCIVRSSILVGITAKWTII